MNKTIRVIQPHVFDLLKTYSFPGNTRELRNIVERAVILCNDNSLSISNICLSSNELKSQNNFIANTFDLEVIERQAIQKALEFANYNKSVAARLLNIEWNALHRRLQKYNIELK